MTQELCNWSSEIEIAEHQLCSARNRSESTDPISASTLRRKKFEDEPSDLSSWLPV